MNRFLVFVALFLSSAAAAQHSDLYIIPAAGHAPGAHGTSWRSDVVLHNVQMVPITVEIALVESGSAPSAPPVALHTIHLMPAETRTLSDIAGSLGRDVTGALIVGAELPFALTSRTWAERPAGRTIGQSVVPVAIAGSADAAGTAGVLPSLTTNDQQRSNAGIFAVASHAPLVIELAMLSPSGAVIGAELIVVDEPGFLHRQLSIPTSTAIVRILEGDGIVVPYASTIDNGSAEAFFVSGSAISVGGESSRAMLAKAVGGTPVMRHR
ncbi:MAG TPA: hypothetical protein VHK90_07375 [Thermoanaerobaculia bacterium]|nr:hypothetical protein [Thermoanaerobaculia bacterium]